LSDDYATIPLYQPEKEEHTMMSKWDTIQADVQDQYTHLDEQQEEEAYMRGDEDEDVFGFSKAISIDHLSDQEIEELSLTLDWKE
jgi:hypothetical protein